VAKEISWLATLGKTVAEVLRRDYGVDPDEVFREAGIDPEIINQPGARVTIESNSPLGAAAIRRTGDPYIGVVFGRSLRIVNAGTLGFAWMASLTMLGGLRRHTRFTRLLSTGLNVELSEADDVTRLIMTLIDPSHRSTIHTSAALVLRFCRLVSDVSFTPRAAYFMEPEPPAAYLGRFKAWFRCPIFFDADIDALDFDTVTLTEPLPAGSPQLIAEGERLLEKQLRELAGKDVIDRVKDTIIRNLPEGRATAANVAKQLNRSVSSLQRDLRSDGESFRSVLEKTRHELAVDYLRDKEHSLGEIAFLLGYADQTGFTRAFRKWEGCTPGQFRG
jgi:AraC-like DNA-binding protein